MTYQEQLEDPRWKAKREEILVLDGRKCQYCKTDKKLNVHHTYYIKGRMAWNYPNHSLITLCIDCHELAHERIKASKYNNERLSKKLQDGNLMKDCKHISEVLLCAIKKIDHA